MKKILGWFQYNENKEEKEETNEKCETCECETCECEGKDESFDGEFDFDTLSLEEKKKLPAALQAYIDKKKGKKGKKEDDKADKGKKGSKPDFLDIDKDGDKKEPMKKAAKEAKKK